MHRHSVSAAVSQMLELGSRCCATLRTLHCRRIRPRIGMQLVFNRTEIAMQNFRSASLAGIAAVALIGSTGAAVAQSADTHVMQVRLPDGGIGEIYYTGNVPPKGGLTSGP